MSRRLLVLPLLLLPFFPSACAEGPFVTSTVLEQRQGRVVICYNKNSTTPEDIVALARQICDKYELPQPQFTDQRAFSCSLTAPAEVTYLCGGKLTPRKGGEERPPVFQREKTGP